MLGVDTPHEIQDFSYRLMGVYVLWDVMLYHWVSVPNILNERSAFEMLGSTNPTTQHHVPDSLNTCHCVFVK